MSSVENREDGAGAERSPLQAATIGQELRAAREDAHLSIEQVAQRTKVRPGILENIEADNHQALPALTYTLGFVKAYARTVGLDPAQAADRYRRESRKGDPVPTIIDMEPLEEQRRPSRGLLWFSGLLLLVALALLWAWGAGWFSPPQPEPPAPKPEEKVAAAPAAEAPAAVVDPATLPVQLKANTEVWLRVNDSANGENLFMGTLKPGQTLDVPAGRAWVLRTGRAGALEATVGQRSLGALGSEAEHLRNFSLKPADLLARAEGKPAAGLPAATPAAPPAAGGAQPPPPSGLPATVPAKQ